MISFLFKLIITICLLIILIIGLLGDSLLFGNKNTGKTVTVWIVNLFVLWNIIDETDKETLNRTIEVMNNKKRK